MAMTSQFSNMTPSSNFFGAIISCQVKLLVQLSCQYHHWFWSYDNSFYKRLTRNLEIGNNPVWVLSNTWRLGRVRNTRFATSLTKCYWILKNVRVPTFTASELLRENQQGGRKLKYLPTPPSPAISFIIFLDVLMFYQIFLSPQVKRWAIITYKYGIYALPHELPNDLILKILGN